MITHKSINKKTGKTKIITNQWWANKTEQTMPNSNGNFCLPKAGDFIYTQHSIDQVLIVGK